MSAALDPQHAAALSQVSNCPKYTGIRLSPYLLVVNLVFLVCVLILTLSSASVLQCKDSCKLEVEAMCILGAKYGEVAKHSTLWAHKQ